MPGFLFANGISGGMIGKFKHLDAALGVAFATGLGDGIYPVYATYGEKNTIKSIRIDFDYPKD